MKTFFLSLSAIGVGNFVTGLLSYAGFVDTTKPGFMIGALVTAIVAGAITSRSSSRGES